ncbi:uncharacterized protein [Aristolochia californica]|uniref:uncharacterized protein isoform X1 n=1 Tax=Aristolochia californica TaxID=171875 RepID=UPI0035E121B1
MIAGLTSGFSSVVQLSLDKRFFRIQRFNQPKLCKLHKLPFSSQLVSTRWYLTTSPKYLSVKCSVSGKANGGIGFEGESHAYPFWLSLIKEAFWALRSLLAFLF